MTFDLWWRAFVNVNPSATERERGIALIGWDRALMYQDAAIAQAVAAERHRCATILREHICNYCDHDHAEDMAQLVEKSNAK